MPEPSLAPVLAREKGYGVATYTVEGRPLDPTEEAPELTWPWSTVVFDRMRRTDGQISATLRAVRLSIGRLAWHLDPAEADPKVVDFIARQLDLPVLGEDRKPARRRRGRFSFAEHVRLAQLRLIYGHMPFEQVYEIATDEDLNRQVANLRKLAPRLPTTIEEINVEEDGGLKSIRQFPLPNQPLDKRKRDPHKGPEIKVNRLVFYTHEREAGAWQGASVLRPIYKNWMLKDRLLRVDTAAAERNGMGVPWITAPENASKDDIEKYAELASSFRAGQEAGGAGPAGSKLSLVGVSGQLPDVLARIKYHDEQITQNLFAQFLRLGQTATGSRALGDSFISFFNMAIDAIAAEFTATFNEHVIEDLVDLNFGPEEAVPVLVPAPAKERRELDATELIALAQAGLLYYDPELEAYVRERYGLPAGDPEQARPLQPQGPNKALPPGSSTTDDDEDDLPPEEEDDA